MAAVAFIAAVRAEFPPLAGDGVVADTAAIQARLDAVTSCVDPFIGCAANGHTYPGATMPFGMVQPGPDSGNGNWDHCSGYIRDEMTIYGFSQTHLSGTGCPDLADVLLLPFTGESRAPVGIKDAYTETSRVGYYSVSLTNFGVRAEITASPRVGWHRWSFPRGTPRKVYVDLQYGCVWNVESVSRRVKSARLALADDRRSFSGANVVSAWLPNRTVAFKVAFSAPWTDVERLPRKAGEKADRLVFTFAPDERPLLAKAAISTTDEAGAALNLAAEAPDWDFDRTASFAFRAWHRLLHAVDVDAPPNVRTSFYTALYHLYTQPNNLADVDGRYRDAAGNVQVSRAPDKSYYSGFSLWDTFRAAHPLYTILVPEKVPAFVESMLSHYRAVGYLPVIPYFGRESFCMIGNHAVPVVVDAALKGFGGFDLDEAFRAIDDSLSRTHAGKPKEDWGLYDSLGYYPFDRVKAESVSRTLECGTDDACAARLARRLGKADRAAFYERRAAYYRNLYDVQTGFFRARDSQGRWIEPFDPFQVGHEGNRPNPYTEGNAWQYRFHVLHDVPGMISLMGGKEAFVAKLDALFEEKGAAVGTDVVRDVSGLVGQYAQGNEQSHHVAYLYTCAGRPDKAAARIGEIFATQYHPTTDGLCGNDDCGQMSAWYVFAALGFYPVDPAGGVYVIGAPQVRRATIHLPGGRKLTMRADGFGAAGAYVRSATFNGRPLDDFSIRHADLMEGGELVLSANMP